MIFLMLLQVKHQLEQQQFQTLLLQTSPIPAGSCVVTGKFSENLTITGL
jgi:hypothetical protein